MRNDIIDPGCKLSAEAVVKPDGSSHLAARFSSHQGATERTQKNLQLPGYGCDLECLPNGIKATRRSRDFGRQYRAASNRKEIASFISSHQSAPQINIRSCIL